MEGSMNSLSCDFIAEDGAITLSQKSDRHTQKALELVLHGIMNGSNWLVICGPVVQLSDCRTTAWEKYLMVSGVVDSSKWQRRSGLQWG